MIRIVVADDNEVLLEHIVKGLKESDKLEVVGIANDGEKELKDRKSTRLNSSHWS